MPIRVNKSEISDEAIFEEMQYHPAPSMDVARHRASEALVVEQLLLQAAKEKNLLKGAGDLQPSEIEVAVDKLLNKEVSVPEADEETCKRYYTQNKERFADTKTKEILPFEHVHTYIRDYLHARSLKTGISQYIKQLAGQARIIGFDFEGAETPLVQ